VASSESMQLRLAGPAVSTTEIISILSEQTTYF